MIEVIAPGPSATVQDLGRHGWAALGVPSSGALDRAALVAANRALGNADGAAAVEVTLGGLHVRALSAHTVVLSGAPCPGAPHGEPFTLRPGDELRLARPEHGMRTYLGVAGGIDVPPVLGSRSYDSLAHLGPPPLRAGDILAAGEPLAAPAAVGARAVDAHAVSRADGVVRVWEGPRAGWVRGGLAHLTEHAWTVTADASRVGVRLAGAPFRRAEAGELPSEAMVTGAVQVPHDGQPIVMLADHPTTGGYPVVAVVDPADIDALAQLRPGDILRFRRASGDRSG